MTEQEWIEQARLHQEKLLSLLLSYHPGASTRYPYVEFESSAPGAEAACEVVRDLIRQEQGAERDIKAEFLQALAKGDTGTLFSLLNSAWFGVPESRGCWGIEGFREAVALLEDPPDQPDQPASGGLIGLDPDAPEEERVWEPDDWAGNEPRV